MNVTERVFAEWHAKLVPGFLTNFEENVSKRIDAVEKVANDLLSSMSCPTFKIQMAVRQDIMKLIKPEIEDKTTVSFKTCKTIPESEKKYHTISRNRLNRNKPQILGNFVFAPIIFDHLYNFCRGLYRNDDSQLEIMRLFIQILDAIFHGEVHYQQTKAQPIIPYNTLIKTNLFRDGIIRLLKYYRIPQREWELNRNERGTGKAQKGFTKMVSALIKIKQNDVLQRRVRILTAIMDAEMDRSHRYGANNGSYTAPPITPINSITPPMSQHSSNNSYHSNNSSTGYPALNESVSFPTNSNSSPLLHSNHNNNLALPPPIMHEPMTVPLNEMEMEMEMEQQRMTAPVPNFEDEKNEIDAENTWNFRFDEHGNNEIVYNTVDDQHTFNDDIYQYGDTGFAADTFTEMYIDNNFNHSTDLLAPPPPRHININHSLPAPQQPPQIEPYQPVNTHINSSLPQPVTVPVSVPLSQPNSGNVYGGINIAAVNTRNHVSRTIDRLQSMLHDLQSIVPPTTNNVQRLELPQQSQPQPIPNNYGAVHGQTNYVSHSRVSPMMTSEAPNVRRHYHNNGDIEYIAPSENYGYHQNHMMGDNNTSGINHNHPDPYWPNYNYHN